MPKPKSFRFARACSVLLAALLGGCATSRATLPEASAPRVHMDPVVVHGSTDPLTGLDGYDASQLLERGNQLYASGEHAKAVLVFDKLVAVFPDSDLVPSAIYNAGLAEEQLELWEPALTRFQRIMKEYPSSPSRKDAMFRAAMCLGKLNRWTEVADGFWAIRQLDGITTMEELEARVGTGVGLFMQNDSASAEREFLAALRFYEVKSKEEFLPAEYFVGQARFYVAEIAARAFESVDLAAPDVSRSGWEEMLGERLEEKCELLLRAQNHLIRAIRAGHPGWATAAGFRIGSLYERLYDDMMKVPTPQGLSEDGKAYYVAEVRKKVAVLVSKAIEIYERSLEMAGRVGEKNEWVERTTRSLERMKDLALHALRDG